MPWFDLIPILAFVATFLLIYLTGMAIVRLQRNPIRERLEGISAGAGPQPPGVFDGSNLLIDPDEVVDHRHAKLDYELNQAGWYHLTARQEFLKLRNSFVFFCLMATAAAAFVLAINDFDMGLNLTLVGLALAALLWALPRLYLRMVGRRRVQRIRRAMPDALDLMSMCLSGGLPLTQAFSYVSREVFGSHPDLAVEFLIVRRHAEMRSFEFAFRKFAQRINAPEVASLSSLVEQGQRLGTDIGAAIRDYADGVRLRRRQSADERANKAGVKLLFPLTMCLLPSVFMILWGPSVIELWTFLSNFQGASAVAGP